MTEDRSRRLKLELENIDREWLEEKERHASLPTLVWGEFFACISMMAGFALVTFGVRLERAQPLAVSDWTLLPAVYMVLGACLVLGSLLFIILIGRRILAYIQVKNSYEFRRDKLLQDIYASGQESENSEADTGS